MPSRLYPAALVALAAALGTLGCRGPDSAADRHFAEMGDQVARTQAEHDKLDSDVAVADDKSALPKPATNAGPVAAPRVVQLGGVDDEPADPNDKTDRPDIRVTGAPGSAPAPRRSVKSGARARIDESEPTGLRPDSAKSSALDPDAKKAYETALAQVQGKQLDKGLEGLNAFLVRWPDHPYAENAMYWRGEAYFAQGEYLRAGEQFEAVLARFGSGSKGPDALLKLGLCQDRLGAPARAREYWDRLKTEYPRSDAAKRIPAAGRDSLPKGPKENR